MRRLLVAVTVIMISVLVLACGKANQQRPAALRTSEGNYVRGDYDEDDYGGNDYDDNIVRSYGHEAGSADRLAVAALVPRYYRAAAAGDGAEACALMDSHLAHGHGLVKHVPEAYVPAAGSSFFNGKSCAEVASLLFEPTHDQLVRDASTVKVIALRIDGSHGLAILIFTKTPESQIVVKREHGRWRVDQFLGEPLV